MTTRELINQTEGELLLTKLNHAFRTAARVRWARLSADGQALVPADPLAADAWKDWPQEAMKGWTANTGGLTFPGQWSAEDVLVRVDMPRERVLETVAHEFYHWLEGDNYVPDFTHKQAEGKGNCSQEAQQFGSEVSSEYIAGRFIVPAWVAPLVEYVRSESKRAG